MGHVARGVSQAGCRLHFAQASATTLCWLNWDTTSVFLGPIETQGSFTGAPFSKKPAAKQKVRPKTQK